MRKFAPLLVAAALVLVGAGCTSSTSTTTDTSTPSQPNPPVTTTGRAVFSVTDDATELNGVTAVQLTVDKVEVHSATQDWVTLSTETHVYSLLELKKTGAAQLLADANIEAGTYDQVRLSIRKVEVTANGKTTEATLPSGTLKIVGKFTVVAGQTSTAKLDFLVDKSLHLTGNGKYVLTPVVRFLTKSHVLKVKIDGEEKIEEDGGDTDHDETHGMDVQGDMKANFELKDKLDIDAGGMVRVHTK